MRIAGTARMVMVLVLLIAGATVFAQDRYALVIQNDRYADLSLPAVGPAVEELTDRLEQAAFAVTHVRNGAKREVLAHCRRSRASSRRETPCSSTSPARDSSMKA
jgi:hypothetical protein